MNYFVTAIGTDSGKTLVSAIMAEMLNASYWKPVQAGFPTDSSVISELISNSETHIYPEGILLQTPASPHAAAKIDNEVIRLEDFQLPRHSGNLVIEGAGGALVPLNQNDVVIDLASKFNAEVVVVSNLYLGSINHTLLTAEVLKSRNIKVKGVIFNGEPNPESEQIILFKTGWKCLLNIKKIKKVDKESVVAYAAELKKNWE